MTYDYVRFDLKDRDKFPKWEQRQTYMHVDGDHYIYLRSLSCYRWFKVPIYPLRFYRLRLNLFYRVLIPIYNFLHRRYNVKK